jgi:hypothetical protein
MADVQTSEVDAKFAQSTLDHEILYDDKSWKNEQFPSKQFLRETKCKSVDNGWNLKFIFYIMETSYEPLYLDKWSLVP